MNLGDGRSSLAMKTRKTPTLLLLCPLLAGLSLAPPGPAVANGFATDVEVVVKLTDGTVRRGTYRPCEFRRIFRSSYALDRRTVFVERLTVVKDAAVVGDYEGAKVEALGALGGFALFDESGLWRWEGWSCSRVVNTTGETVRVTGHYGHGRMASVTLPPCEPLLWTSGDLARPKSTGRCRTRWSKHCRPAKRTVITRGGVMIHDLPARAFREMFKRRRGSTLSIGESGVTVVHGSHGSFGSPAPLPAVCALAPRG